MGALLRLKCFSLTAFLTFAPTSLALDDTQKLWQEGIKLISIGKNLEAESVFLKMLSFSPDFFPPNDSSPKIILSFQNARNTFKKLNEKKSLFNAGAHLENELLEIKVSVPKEFQTLLTKIKIFFRTDENAAYRLKTLLAPFIFFEGLLRFPAMNASHRTYYFIEFIGRYNEPFAQIGSASNPMMVKETMNSQIYEQTLPKTTTWTAFKEKWPFFAAVTVALIGSLTYGLLMLD